MAGVGVSAIGHVALKVPTSSARFPSIATDSGFEEMMRLDREDGNLWLVYLRITDTQFLELFPGGEGERAPGPERTAVNRFCLECADLDATAAFLRAADAPLTVEPKIGLDRNRQCWIEDPDGTRIEFMQMAANAMQREAIERLRAKRA